jgi:hypothetical protein
VAHRGSVVAMRDPIFKAGSLPAALTLLPSQGLDEVLRQEGERSVPHSAEGDPREEGCLGKTSRAGYAR